MEKQRVELTWHKAAKSGNGGECVEVGSASDGHAAGIRDSKRPHDGYLVVTPVILGALLDSVKAGRLDMPSCLEFRASSVRSFWLATVSMLAGSPIAADPRLSRTLVLAGPGAAGTDRSRDHPRC
jgi:hypothetical protein